MELKHEDLAKDVAALTATTAQVVLNQKHAEELNELRFKSLDTAVSQISTDLKGFMVRIDGIMTGEVETTQSRAGRELVAEWTSWRKEVEAWRDVQDQRNAVQGGVLKTLSGAKGIILMVCAIVSPIVAAVGIIVTRP